MRLGELTATAAEQPRGKYVRTSTKIPHFQRRLYFPASAKMTALNSCRARVCGLRYTLRTRSGRHGREYSFAQCLAKYLPHVINKNEADIFEGLLWHLVQI